MAAGAFELELRQAFEQHGGLVGGLHRFAGHFEQRVELDRVDADAVFLGRRGGGAEFLHLFFAAVDAIPAGLAARRRGSGAAAAAQLRQAQLAAAAGV